MDGLQQDIVTDVDSDQIDPQVYDLYDQYCHSDMDRREFLKRAAALSVVGAVSGLAMAQALFPALPWRRRCFRPCHGAGAVA